jgi:hypothetical protein
VVLPGQIGRTRRDELPEVAWQTAQCIHTGSCMARIAGEAGCNALSTTIQGIEKEESACPSSRSESLKWRIGTLMTTKG